MDINGQFDDIFDLTGIEAFVNITELYCQLNALTTLDLSQNTALVHLECWENPLTSLNVTQCVALELLGAEHTQLTDLDVSNNANLAIIAISDADLISLDLTNNSNLESISLYNLNPLNFLDIRNGNNTNIAAFGSHENPNLTCIFVDDTTYWETNFGSNIDPNSHFVETQAECDALGINNYQIQQFNIFPNPAKDFLKIELSPELSGQKMQLVLSNILGKELIRKQIFQPKTTLELLHLQKGIYFLTFYSNTKKLLTKKIIKL